MRIALIIFAALTLVSMFLLSWTSSETSIVAEYDNWLFYINVGLIIIILALIGAQVFSLIQRFRHREFGSRLTLTLVGLFTTLGIVPVLLVYIVSAQFLTRSIESWFNVPIENALTDAQTIGNRTLELLKKEQERRTRQVAYHLSSVPETEKHRHLVVLLNELDAESIQLVSNSGRIILSVSDPPFANSPRMVPKRVMDTTLINGAFSDFVADGETQTKIMAIAALDLSTSMDAMFVQIITKVPDSLAPLLQSVEEASGDYQTLALGREILKGKYLMILSMVFISTLLVSIAVAFLFSNRLAAPLSVLAEGTRAVAEGDYSPRQSIGGADELALLTRSFNQMTQQLEDARQSAEKNRQAVETARAHLENILFNLSTGVLALDDTFRIQTINQGSQRILGDSLKDLLDIPIPQWPRHITFARTVYGHFITSQEPHWQDQKTIEEDGREYTLLIRGSRISEATSGGYVVVFDDITNVIQAQKLSAWSEVAQRLAHEIKNPLTPIQLSAERILFKLGPKLAEQDEAFLERSTNIIVEQVNAMKTMVNSFRLYAKLPLPKLEPLNLNAFIREMLHLYEEAEVPITTDLDENLPLVHADVDQIRQVVHNLVQNGQDAQIGQSEERFVRILTVASEVPQLIIEDNGPGFPEAVLRRAFEPYVTTKSKGTGLGLAIVKRIIDEHRGTIFIDNKPQRGCKITINLTYAT